MQILIYAIELFVLRRVILAIKSLLNERISFHKIIKKVLLN